MRPLIVIAHADDETIGASHLLGPDARLLHVTDSAPRNPKFFLKHGFDTREAYARQRRKEMLDAVQLAGMTKNQCAQMKIPDQEAILHLERIARRIRAEAKKHQSTVIYTHAYEGGHPDHDACALAANEAASQTRLPVREMPYYHAATGTMIASTFIPAATKTHHPKLTRHHINRKKKMFEAFTTQRHVFDRFAIEAEPWRPAPAHDFLEPPHPGPLYYETRDLGWTYAEWRRHAAAFLLAPRRR